MVSGDGKIVPKLDLVLCFMELFLHIVSLADGGDEAVPQLRPFKKIFRKSLTRQV